MDAGYIIKLVNDFGFPVVLTVLMGGFIWYMFKYVTTELKPKLGQANGVLIGLIDRIRMMDNDDEKAYTPELETRQSISSKIKQFITGKTNIGQKQTQTTKSRKIKN